MGSSGKVYTWFTMFKRLPVWVGFACLVLNTFAQAELRVIVTDGLYRSSSLEEAQLNRATVSRELIRRDQFSSKLTNVSEVLEKHANITVRANGGLGAYSTLSIRGSNSRQVLLLLDGVPINDVSTGGVDLSQFSMDQFERIEVYKGNVPIEFGLSSAGGAVNLVTRKLEEKKTEVGIGGGSFETEKLSFSHNQSFERSRILLVVDALDAKNNFPFISDAGTPLFSGDDFSDKRINNEYEQRTALVKYSLDINERQNFTFSLNALDKEKSLPSSFNSPLANSKLSSQQQRYSFSFQQRMDKGKSIQLTYQGKNSEQQYRDVRGDIGLGRQSIDYKTPQNSIFLRFQKAWGTWRLHAQAAVQRDEFDLINLPVAPGQQVNQSNCKSTSVCDLSFIRDQLSTAWGVDKSLERHKLSFNINTKLIDDENKSQRAIVIGDGLGEVSYTTAQLGWAYDSLLRWRANISNSVRVPSSYELFGDTGFSKGNSTLKTERSQLLEVGLGRRLHGWNFDSSFFFRSIDDLIIPERDSRGVASYQNVSHAAIFGWDALLEKHWLSGWGGGVKLSQIDSNIDSEISAFDQSHISGTFHFQANSFLSWSSATWDVKLQRQFASGLFYNRTNSVKADSKNQTNASIVYKNKLWRIDLSVNNIFDERFHDFDRLPAEGRSVFVFSKLSF